jgi:hypothetical protein
MELCSFYLMNCGSVNAASLLAVDGSTTDDIAGQVGALSVGGNDALQ